MTSLPANTTTLSRSQISSCPKFYAKVHSSLYCRKTETFAFARSESALWFVTETYLLAKAPNSIPAWGPQVVCNVTLDWFLFYTYILFRRPQAHHFQHPCLCQILHCLQQYPSGPCFSADRYPSLPSLIGLDPQTAHNVLSHHRTLSGFLAPAHVLPAVVFPLRLVLWGTISVIPWSTSTE
ncbi:hypothetical protein SCLCIDRAFT_1210259 [Scleroderma citrinum Foug A]|uniref:Uncharacterized protein n=1 Tax=Scleroderma citrinum Foug A TaxID=1036808 RepID=A0A0C3E4A7_9AGAM|nr:hypothetical protein SCLCIDRAFT_1210259 [Scleroderma citrinum Foug A]